MPSDASEIEAWLRRVRQLETSGRAAVDDAHRLVSSQRAQVEKLKLENAHMQEELAIDKAPARHTSNTQQDRVEKLQELADSFQRKIEVERRQVELIDKELEVHQAKVSEVRKAVSGPAAAGEVHKAAVKSLKVLENRLEQAEKRFSESISRNKELRDVIDSMAKQQAAVEQVLSKLEKELATKRSEVASIQGTVSICLDARTAALEEAAALAAQGDREEAAFEEELKELAGCLDTDQKLLQLQTKRFMRVLGSTPAPVEVGGLDEPSPERATAQLQETCGITPLQELLAHCRSLEASNFDIFTRCNRTSDEVSRLQKEARSAQAELRNLELEGVLGKQKDIIRQTLGRRDQAIRRSELLHDKYGTLHKRLQHVQTGVLATLKALGAAPPPAPAATAAAVAAAADNPAAATAASLLLQLAQLEAQARVLVAVRSTVMGKPSQVTAAVAGRLLTQLPSTLDKDRLGRDEAASAAQDSDNGSDDDDEMPLTRQQIQARMKS